MKKFTSMLFCLTSIWFSISASYAAGLTNLDIVKQQFVSYYSSGQYQKDLEHSTAQALQYLKTRINNHKDLSKKLAIVLDIDETSLSNYPDMLAMNFGGTLQQVMDAEGKGTDPVIQPTLELYRLAKENNVAVFFITGRWEAYRAATIRNLLQAGYQNWDGLVLRNQETRYTPAAEYKTAERKKITEQGYDIILNVGDQQSDLAGGYADKTFQLPNPYYLIP